MVFWGDLTMSLSYRVEMDQQKINNSPFQSNLSLPSSSHLPYPKS